MTFPARFDGICKACHRPYSKGARIGVLRARGPKGGKQYGHADCCAAEEPGRSDPAPAEPTGPDPIPYVPVPFTAEHLRYDHARDFAATVEPGPRTERTETATQVPWRVAVEILDKGDGAAVAEIEKARDAAQSIVMPFVQRLAERWDVRGHRVSVSRYLGGAVCAMRRRIQSADDAGPVRVYVSAGAVHDEKKSALYARIGMACAVVDAIATRRPVELWGCCALTEPSLVASWRIDDPRDLASAAAALGEPMLRGIICRRLDNRGGGGGYPSRTIEIDRERLGLLPDDIYVPPLASYRQHGTPEHIMALAKAAFGIGAEE